MLPFVTMFVVASSYGQTIQDSGKAEASAITQTGNGGRGGAGVEGIRSMRDSGREGGAAVGVKHKLNYEFAVKDGDWLDTGIVLQAAEEIDFTAEGSMNLSDGRVAGPDGLERGWKDLLRQFPLNSAKTGELIGRVSDVGASVPFAVGTKGDVTVPTSGKLYLRANVSSDLSPSGSFKVTIRFVHSSAKPLDSGELAAKALPGLTGSAGGISGWLTPEAFADVPRRVADRDGNAGDMVNFALLGTRDRVESAFKSAGWVAVDKTVQDALVHGLLATLGHEAYTEMPMSTLYLFGREQDMSFARGDPLKVAAERHHLRLWSAGKSLNGKEMWVGSATLDVGFEKDQRNGNVTHKIDPKVDGERDFLLQSFDAAGVFTSAAYVTPADPVKSAKTATGGSFESDGRIVVMDLH